METHIITVLAEDKPGVLARMTIMFGRRGINLISVTASPSLKEGLSRLMLVVHGNDKDVEKMQKHLANLVEIVSIKTLAKDDIVRELCLIKIKEKDNITRMEILQMCSLFGAQIIDMSPFTLTIEIVERPEAIDRFIANLKPFGMKEIYRSGMIATTRESEKVENRKMRKILS
jgi:acetolactate synthase-1/3 small subunit